MSGETPKIGPKESFLIEEKGQFKAVSIQWKHHFIKLIPTSAFRFFVSQKLGVYSSRDIPQLVSKVLEYERQPEHVTKRERLKSLQESLTVIKQSNRYTSEGYTTAKAGRLFFHFITPKLVNAKSSIDSGLQKLGEMDRNFSDAEKLEEIVSQHSDYSKFKKDNLKDSLVDSLNSFLADEKFTIQSKLQLLQDIKKYAPGWVAYERFSGTKQESLTKFENTLLELDQKLETLSDFKITPTQIEKKPYSSPLISKEAIEKYSEPDKKIAELIATWAGKFSNYESLITHFKTVDVHDVSFDGKPMPLPQGLNLPESTILTNKSVFTPACIAQGLKETLIKKGIGSEEAEKMVVQLMETSAGTTSLYLAPNTICESLKYVRYLKKEIPKELGHSRFCFTWDAQNNKCTLLQLVPLILKDPKGSSQSLPDQLHIQNSSSVGIDEKLISSTLSSRKIQYEELRRIEEQYQDKLYELSTEASRDTKELSPDLVRGYHEKFIHITKDRTLVTQDELQTVLQEVVGSRTLYGAVESFSFDVKRGECCRIDVDGNRIDIKEIPKELSVDEQEQYVRSQHKKIYESLSEDERGIWGSVIESVMTQASRSPFVKAVSSLGPVLFGVDSNRVEKFAKIYKLEGDNKVIAVDVTRNPINITVQRNSNGKIESIEVNVQDTMPFGVTSSKGAFIPINAGGVFSRARYRVELSPHGEVQVKDCEHKMRVYERESDVLELEKTLASHEQICRFAKIFGVDTKDFEERISTESEREEIDEEFETDLEEAVLGRIGEMSDEDLEQINKINHTAYNYYIK